MNKEINFLKEKASILRKKSKHLFILKTGSLVLLVLYGLAVLAVFSYSFVLKKESDVLAERTSQTKERIEKFQPVETKQVYIKSKIESLTEIFASQRENQKIIEAVFTFLPEGISVTGFSIGEKGWVTFSGQSKSFERLKNFFANFETAPKIGELEVKEAKVESVSFNYKEGYSFKISLLFGS